MYQVIIVVHVLLGLGVVGLVLMQQGKGADAGAAFGTGSSGSVFGAQGAASFLSRATAILATLFFMTSLGLAVLNGKQGASFDLMNAPKVEQDTLGVPDVGGAKGVVSELPVTEQKTEEVPVAAPDAKPSVEKK
jgi:preprotein translocase subunit SecG